MRRGYFLDWGSLLLDIPGASSSLAGSCWKLLRARWGRPVTWWACTAKSECDAHERVRPR